MLASVVGLYVQSAAGRQRRRTCLGPGQLDFGDRRPDAGCSSASSSRSRSRRRCSRCTPGCRTPRSRRRPAPRCCWSACWTRSAPSAWSGSASRSSRRPRRWATPVVVVLAIVSILYGALMAIGQNNIPRLIAYTSVLALRLHRARHLRDEQPGPVRREPLHVQPRALDGRAVPGDRLPDQAAGLCPDQRLRRRREGGAGARRVVPAGRPLVAVAAGPLAASSPSCWCWSGPSSHSPVAASFAVLGIVLAAIYILLMYQRTMTGPVRPRRRRHRRPGPRRSPPLAPLLVLIVVLGFFPKPLLDVINPTVRDTLQPRRQERPCSGGRRRAAEGSSK